MKIIVLDRDGVINHDSDAFIKSADEWQPIAGSLKAIARLKACGWKVAVATNQSGIARGYYGRQDLTLMHQKFAQLLHEAFSDRHASEDDVQAREKSDLRQHRGLSKIDWISFAPYLSEDESPARKPGIGMLKATEQALGVNLEGAPFVGDTWVDIQAARAAKMQPYLVRTGKGERTLAAHPDLVNEVPVMANLAEVVEHLCEQ